MIVEPWLELGTRADFEQFIAQKCCVVLFYYKPSWLSECAFREYLSLHHHHDYLALGSVEVQSFDVDDFIHSSPTFCSYVDGEEFRRVIGVQSTSRLVNALAITTLRDLEED